MSAMEPYLEPMTSGMILDRSFRLYVQNFALMIGLTAIVHLPVLILTVVVPLLQETSMVLAVLAGLVGLLTALVTTIIVNPLVTGAATKAVSERYLGNEITVTSALKFAWSYVGTLLLIQIIVGLILIVGFLLLIVPGILWALSYSLVAPVAVLEHSSDGGEIRHRSWNLVKDNRWKVFTVLIMIVLAQALLGLSGSFFIQMVYGSVSSIGQALGGLISSIASLLIYPLQPIAITLLYYDLRIRKEGFDLEMLSRAIAAPEATT